MKINKNKRAQVGLSLSWFVAFVFIFFIMLFFLAASSSMASLREIPAVSWILGYGKNAVNLGEYAPGDMSLQRGLEVFVSTPVEFQGNILRIKDLFSGKLFAGQESAKAERFKSLGGVFLESNSRIAPETYYSGMWLRVYDSGEEILKSYSGKNEAFGIAYGGSCNPKNEEASVLKVLLSETKLLVLCTEK